MTNLYKKIERSYVCPGEAKRSLRRRVKRGKRMYCEIEREITEQMETYENFEQQ